MTAPFFANLAEGPEDGHAEWLTTADGIRIRVGIWNRGAPKGTVFLLPGRSEYVEKYGRTAQSLAQEGYATLTVDWRGQGLAARAHADPMLGHIADFAEYQTDLDAVLAYARQHMAPPYYLLPHSMGGCIALRALHRGLPFNAVAFSAPMWGIAMADALRPVARLFSTLATRVGLGHLYTPGTRPTSYVLTEAFAANTLTTDADMWAYMRRQCEAEPAFALGGPSMAWLRAALQECTALTSLPAPNCAAICALGSAEKVVDPRPIHALMARWPQARLDLYDGAEHEILMETPARRNAFLHSAVSLFSATPPIHIGPNTHLS